MNATATLSSKHQISIPKAVREEQHWSAGQEFVFLPKGTGVLLMPVPELKALAGIAAGAAQATTVTAGIAPDARGRHVRVDRMAHR